MRKKSKETEQQIYSAARAEFISKGLFGARMQAIADRAKINKAMLHYYFKTKDDLFNAVLEKEVELMFETVGQVVHKDLPFVEKMHTFIDVYHDLLEKKSFGCYFHY